MNGMEVLEKVINDLIKLIEAGFSFNIAGRPVFIAPSTIMMIVILGIISAVNKKRNIHIVVCVIAILLIADELGCGAQVRGLLVGLLQQLCQLIQTSVNV